MMRGMGNSMIPGMQGMGGYGSSIPGLDGFMRMQGAGSPMASPTFSGQSGMMQGNPMGELQAHSNFATRFQRNPGSGPAMGGFGF